jgi:polysaccharide biosynthesis protein PslA
MSAVQNSKFLPFSKINHNQGYEFAEKPTQIGNTHSQIEPSLYAWSITKRLFDVVISSAALLCLSPLLLMIVIAIRIDSNGRALFKQERWGAHQSKIMIYKFRSMFTDIGDMTGVKQTTLNDPRLTRVGAALRRFNLDELPQLFNVLRGDMSIVGPRCHVPNMLAGGMLYEELIPIYHGRHSVKPGLTGLAQMKGLRGPTANAVKAKQRVICDIAYIQNASFWLDLKICFMTLINEMNSRKGF